MPTPEQESAPTAATSDRRISVMEAQVMSMRGQALASAETLKALALQCETFLMILGTMSSLREMTRDSAPLKSPAAGMPRRTFGHKTAEPDGEDESPANTTADALADRIATALDPHSTKEPT